MTSNGLQAVTFESVSRDKYESEGVKFSISMKFKCL